MSVQDPPQDRFQFSVGSALRWFRKFGAAVAAVPIGLTFLFYAFDRGAAAAFGIPGALVKPDPSKLYEAALFSIPIILIILVVGLSATGPSASAETAEKKEPRKHGLWLALALRLFISLAIGASEYFFVHPSEENPNFWRDVLITSTVLFITLCLPIAISAAAHYWRKKTLIPINDSDPIYRFISVIAAVCIFAYLATGAFSVGYSSARTDTSHYILPGLKPELLLLSSSDGFVTADYDPKSRTIRAEYRWHEWKEHRQMILVRTGKLPTMQVLTLNDAQIRESDSATAKPENK